MLRLSTFGGLGLAGDNGSAAPRLRPPRLALLAALAGAGERGASRERLLALFWPDSDEAHARHSLRQLHYALRQDLGCDVVRSDGATLTLDPSRITSDLAEFRAALAAHERARAVGIACGGFLDGFYLPGAPEFERWVEEERSRLTTAVKGVLTELASAAALSGDRDAAAEWSRQLTVLDPLSGRFAAAYIEALAARGDRALALAFARKHEALVRDELGADADPDVTRLEAHLRALQVAEVARSTDVPPAAPGDEPDEPDERAGSRSSGDPAAALAADAVRETERSPARRGAYILGAVALVVVVATAAAARQRGWLGESDRIPTLAVGLIRDAGVPDSLRIGRVLTDMLATNLARVNGLPVLANSRLMELIRPGRDSSAAVYIDAARRAGATELLEGRVLATARSRLTLELRRVDVETGIVRRAYRVGASDLYALVDSMTRAITDHLELSPPRASVADATTSSPMAYRLYEEGLRAYAQFNFKAALQLMRAALAEDSTFAMAAYYEAELLTGSDRLPDGRHITEVRSHAVRLARRAPERERLTITAQLLALDNEPRALAVAESLAARFADDPRALMALARLRDAAGDRPGAVQAVERAIALDSAAGPIGMAAEPNCRLCEDMNRLVDIYFWWDSLPAVERVARRLAAVVPGTSWPYYSMALAAARRGDSAAAYAHYRRLSALGGGNLGVKLGLDLTVEAYDVLERDVRPVLASSFLDDWSTGAWRFVIALRNQGRLREAMQFHRTGHLPGLPVPTIEVNPDRFNEGILAFERGDARRAAEVFGRAVRFDMSRWSAGAQARHRAWHGTLQGMALAAAGDTGAVRALADSVEAWGRGSLYGRDRRAHHYLRGLVLAAEGRHEAAVRAYRAAMHSPTLGFTRVNYELGRCLMRLGRPVDAVAAVQPALRGEVDASNLYITRTELHELLAQAFAAAGVRDSAAVHYRAVAKAWARADPAFHARRAAARGWLARYNATPYRHAAAR